MIKPDAVSAGHTGAITKMIEEAGFRIVAMKKVKLTSELAGQFYALVDGVKLTGQFAGQFYFLHGHNSEPGFFNHFRNRTRVTC